MSAASVTGSEALKELAGKAVIFCNWRDPEHRRSGGAELYCFSVAERFSRAGARVTVLTARDAGQSSNEVRRGVAIRRVGGTYTVYLHALLWLLRNRKDIDMVVDCQNGIPFFSPVVVRRTTAVTCILFHVHQDQFSLYFSKPLAALGRVLESTVSRRVYGVRPFVAISPSTRDEARRRLGIKGSVHVVASGMDSPPRLSDTRSPLPRIAVVGRLVPHKRFNLLLEAIPEVRCNFPEFRVDLVGDGPDRQRLEDIARTLGVDTNVTFYGHVDDQERDQVLAMAWLTVNPSVGEGWGLSVIEANAHGLPAIAFRVPGLRDAVRDGRTGWLVDEGTPLASPIIDALRVLSDQNEAEAWRMRARRWAAGFSWDDTAGRIASVLVVERDRLQRRTTNGGSLERRRMSDLTTRVRVRASDELPVVWRGRRTDVVRKEGGVIDLLMFGADERDVESLLPQRDLNEELHARIARPSDLLGTPPDADLSDNDPMLRGRDR